MGGGGVVGHYRVGGSRTYATLQLPPRNGLSASHGSWSAAPRTTLVPCFPVARTRPTHAHGPPQAYAQLGQAFMLNAQYPHAAHCFEKLLAIPEHLQPSDHQLRLRGGVLARRGLAPRGAWPRPPALSSANRNAMGQRRTVALMPNVTVVSCVCVWGGGGGAQHEVWCIGGGWDPSPA